MNHVERFTHLMRFEPVDRLPVVEWASYWDQTIERWHAEGLPAEWVEPHDVRGYFRLDSYRQLWVDVQAPTCPRPAFHGAGLVRDLDEYRALKAHLYPAPAFDRGQLADWAEAQQRGDTVIWFTLLGFFWHPRQLLGIERHLYTFYDDPGLMHVMNRDLLEFNLHVLDEICEVCTPSFMTFAEDMSYNHGPMLSRKCFDEFLAPYYKGIVPALLRREIVPLVDSDGDVTPMIPWLEEVGIEGILPLERMAGVDVADIRRSHPHWKMIGAFDKTVMHRGESAMRAEFDRLLPVMWQGGFIPGVDHQTPPDVSLEMYRLYVSLLREYAGKGAR